MAVVQATNIIDWIVLVDWVVKPYLYFTPVALGTPEEMVKDREVNWAAEASRELNSGKTAATASRAARPKRAVRRADLKTLREFFNDI
jgi:hypothetical protein